MQTVLSKLTPSAAFPNLGLLSKLTQMHSNNTYHSSDFSIMRAFIFCYEADYKTYLRNRAGDDRLSDLTVLFAHKNRLVDLAILIETFAERLQFHSRHLIRDQPER